MLIGVCLCWQSCIGCRISRFIIVNIVAELLKRHISGLHQLTTTTTVSLTDIWEPTVEGLERIETKRLVSAIEITLSKAPLDASAVSRIHESLADGQTELEALEASLDSRGPTTRGRGGRGRGRGPRGRGGRGRRPVADEIGEHAEADGDAPATKSI